MASRKKLVNFTILTGVFFLSIFAGVSVNARFAAAVPVDDFVYEVAGSTTCIPVSGGQYSVSYQDLGGVHTLPGSQGMVVNFNSPGTALHDIRISGNFSAIDDDPNCRPDVTDVKQWGSARWTNLRGAFSGTKNFMKYSAVDMPNLTAGPDLSAMFMNSNFNGDIAGWDVSAVTNMSDMFHGAAEFDQPVGRWDTSKVTTMARMFLNAYSFKKPLDGWDVSSVSDMTEMLTNTNIPAPNYDLTLESWSKQPVKKGVSLGAFSIEYATSGTARQRLIDEHGWKIEGDGLSRRHVRIELRDAVTGKGIGGSEFEVREMMGFSNYVTHIVTDANGIALSPPLGWGEYYLTQLSTPSAYVPKSTPMYFSTFKLGTRERQLTNERAFGRIRVVKKDAVSGALLSGAEFDVKDAGGAVVAHLVTDAGGAAVSDDLPVGDYTLVEVIAPVGYAIESNPVPVRIERHGQVSEVPVGDAVVAGKIQVHVQDGVSGAPLSGAEFDVKDAGGAVVAHLVSDGSGLAASGDLPLGDYSIVPTLAPAKYILDPGAFSVRLGKHGQVVDTDVLFRAVAGSESDIIRPLPATGANSSSTGMLMLLGTCALFTATRRIRLGQD